MKKQRFSAAVPSTLLAEVGSSAIERGRSFEVVVAEALSEWVDRRREFVPRDEVLLCPAVSMERNDELLRGLA